MLKHIIFSFALALSAVACIGAPEPGEPTPDQDQATDKTEAVATSDEALTSCPKPVACVAASRNCIDPLVDQDACNTLGLCCSCYENFCG